MLKSIFLSLLPFILLCCGQKTPDPVFPLPKNAKVLLAGDTSKVWKLARRYNNGTRMNMGDCFLKNRQTYFVSNTMEDNSGNNPDCGQSLMASWKFVKDKEGYYYLRWESEQLAALMNIDDNFKLFKILQLSEEQITLQFFHKFGAKQGKIIDVYVPQDVKIEDRDFHW